MVDEKKNNPTKEELMQPVVPDNAADGKHAAEKRAIHSTKAIALPALLAAESRQRARGAGLARG